MIIKTSKPKLAQGQLDPKDFVRKARDKGRFTLDIETFGLQPLEGQLKGFAAKTGDHTVWYGFGRFGGHEQRRIFRDFQPLWGDPEIEWINFHNKFEWKWMTHNGAKIRNKMRDAMIASYLLNEDRKFLQLGDGQKAQKYGLKKLVFEHFGIKMSMYADTKEEGNLFGRTLGDYARDDVVYTEQLYDYYVPMLHDDDMWEVFEHVDMPLVPILADMELTGILVDHERLAALERRYRDKQIVLEKKIWKACGQRFDIGKAHEVARLLFNTGVPDLTGKRRRIPLDDDENPVPVGKSGRPSTTNKVLEYFVPDFPIIDDMLKWRHWGQLISTFTQGLLEHSRASSDGRVRSSFNQTVARTGRLSCVAGDTLLATNHGTFRISELDISDGRNYTIETHTGSFRRIERHVFKGWEEMYEVRLADGSSITCTEEHRFLTPGGWQALGALRIGDVVTTAPAHSPECSGAGERTLSGSVGEIVCSHLPERGAASEGDQAEVRAEQPGSGYDSGPLPGEVRRGVEGGPRASSFHCASRQQAWRGLALFAEQEAPGAASGTRVVGRTDRTRYEDDAALREPQHPALPPSPDIPASAATSTHVSGGVGPVRGAGPRIHGGRQAVLRGTSQVLSPRLRGDGSSLSFTGRPAISATESPLPCRERAYAQGSHLVVSESPRTDVVTHADSARCSTHPGVLLLSELEVRLCLSRYSAAGGGRRRVSQQGWDYEAPRPEEGQESTQARLLDHPVHDITGRSERARCGCAHRPSSESTIVSITPVGVHGVWDIGVEGDESYVAHGFVNHNSSHPNMQNIPRAEKDEGDPDWKNNSIRGAIIAAPGNSIADADLSQIELRIMAYLSNDPKMLECYRSNGICKDNCKEYQASKIKDPKEPRCGHTDIHTRTANETGAPRNPVAKCLDGRTLLSTSIDNDTPRLMTIRHLFQTACPDATPGHHRAVYDGAGYAVSDGRLGVVRIKSGLVRPSRSTKIVVTKRAVVVATNDHRFQVIGGGLGNLPPNTPGYVHVEGMSLVEADKLKKGMCLPMGDAAHPRADDAAFHRERAPVVIRLNPFTKEMGDGPASLMLDEPWAYFAGMFAGDGCASGNACVITHGHTPEYEEWRQTVRRACDQVGLPTSVSGDKRQTRFGSRVVRRYLASLELCQEEGVSGRRILEVPSWVLGGGPSVMWSYLAGLFDTDGTVGKQGAGTASVTTGNPEFAGQIAMLLRWLGMPILVQPGYNKTYEKYYYTIHVLGEGLERFQAYCPLRRRDKVERLTDRNAAIKRRCAPGNDEVLLVLDGGEREVFDFHIDNEDHLYLQGGLIGHNNLNFGCQYRMGPRKARGYIKVKTVAEAKEFIDAWFKSFKGVRRYHNDVDALLRANGWIMETVVGRKRRLGREAAKNDFRAVTQGINHAVQGSAGDLIKLAMIKWWKKRCELAETDERWANTHPIMQIHDEFATEGPDEVAPESLALIQECMNSADGGQLGVPLASSGGCGKRWSEAH